MLVQDIIATAMSDLGLIAPEETPSPSELTRGQQSLNNLLASWSSQGLPIPAITQEFFNLTGAQTYAFGPGLAFNAPRPIKLEAAAVALANGAKKACHIGTVEQWAAVYDNTATALFADLLYWDGNYPNGTISLYPRAAAGGTLTLWMYMPLTQYANLTDTVDLPPGYLRAIEWALGLELARTFGVPITADLIQMANDAKVSITGLNEAILGKPNTVEPANPAIPPQQAA